MYQHLNCRGPRRRREKGFEKFFGEIIVENFPNMEKGNSQSSSRGTESPIQDKHKKKHAKTHTNQTHKDSTQIKNIKSSKGEATSNIQGKSHSLTADLSAETLQAMREWQDIFKALKREKSTTKITVPGKDLIQN